MAAAGKIVITGTGRAGTTFLVRLLTELGCDTGFDRSAPANQTDFFAHCAAGLERDLQDPACPRIVKNPALCDTLPSLLAAGSVNIEHAIIPVRNLHAAAASRCRIGPTDVPGGMWDADDFESQCAALARKYYHLVQTLVAAEVPITFLAFPRLVTDADYLHARIGWLVEHRSRDEFARAFARLADPSLVHAFPTEQSPDEPATQSEPVPTREFRARQVTRRRRRHLARLIVWFVSVLIAAAAGALCTVRG